MSEQATITSQAQWMLDCAREAKAARDADGEVSPKQDAQLARMEAGDFTGLIVTPGRITGLTRPDGQQGDKPETVARVENGQMIGERPAGKGAYGRAKKAITAAQVTPAQISYIEGLIEETTRYDATRGAGAQKLYDTIRNSPKGLTGGRNGTASGLITALIGVRDSAKAAAPAKPTRPARGPLPEVPNGYYAITGADGTLKFYRVTNHKNGRVYVNVQASDAWYDVKFGAYRGILAEIAKDPQAAGKRYADEIGNCYCCNRILTDDTSRADGRGPICRNK